MNPGLYLEVGTLNQDSIRVRTLFKSGLYIIFEIFEEKIMFIQHYTVEKFYDFLSFLVFYEPQHNLCISNQYGHLRSSLHKNVSQFHRIIFESGLYSSQDSINISYLWIRTLFELGLYLSQASNNDSTVYTYYD